MIRYQKPGQPEWGTSTVHDISTGGVRFLCEFSVEVGTLLDLQLVLPALPKPVLVQGRVVWTRLAQARLVDLGISFQAPQAEQQMITQAIAHFLRTRPRRFMKPVLGID